MYVLGPFVLTEAGRPQAVYKIICIITLLTAVCEHMHYCFVSIDNFISLMQPIL